MFRSGKRHNIKLQDKLIEKERERERKLEGETTQDNSQTHTITHFSHPHPLTYLQPDYVAFSCNSCEKRGRGKRYHCDQCKFDIHKICTQTPLTWLLRHMRPEERETHGVRWDHVITTFVHPDHQVAIEYKRRSFKCGHCNDSGNGLRFRCAPCDIEFHPVCATNPTRLTTYLHPEHELELMIRPHFKKCDLCGTDGPTNNRMYRCKQCEFYLHPECSQWPLYLAHPIHPPHPLMLKPCEGVAGGHMYSCKPCELNFSLHYIFKQSKLGVGEEVRPKYAGHQMNVLPLTNLTLPAETSQVQAGSSVPLPGLARAIAEIAIASSQ